MSVISSWLSYTAILIPNRISPVWLSSFSVWLDWGAWRVFLFIRDLVCSWLGGWRVFAFIWTCFTWRPILGPWWQVPVGQYIRVWATWEFSLSSYLRRSYLILLKVGIILWRVEIFHRARRSIHGGIWPRCSPLYSLILIVRIRWLSWGKVLPWLYSVMEFTGTSFWGRRRWLTPGLWNWMEILTPLRVILWRAVVAQWVLLMSSMVFTVVVDRLRIISPDGRRGHASTVDGIRWESCGWWV